MLPIGHRSPPRHELSHEAKFEDHVESALFPGIPAVGPQHAETGVKADDVSLEVPENILPPLGFAVERREIEDFVYLQVNRIDEGWWAFDNLCVGDLIVSLNDQLGFQGTRTLIDLDFLLHQRPLKIYLLRPSGHKPPSFLFPPKAESRLSPNPKKDVQDSYFNAELKLDHKFARTQIFARKTYSLDWQEDDQQRHVDAEVLRDEFYKRRLAASHFEHGDFDPYGQHNISTAESRLHLRREMAEVTATFEKRMQINKDLDAFAGDRKAVHEVFDSLFGSQVHEDGGDSGGKGSSLFKVDSYGADPAATYRARSSLNPNNPADVSFDKIHNVIGGEEKRLRDEERDAMQDETDEALNQARDEYAYGQVAKAVSGGVGGGGGGGVGSKWENSYERMFQNKLTSMQGAHVKYQLTEALHEGNSPGKYRGSYVDSDNGYGGGGENSRSSMFPRPRGLKPAFHYDFHQAQNTSALGTHRGVKDLHSKLNVAMEALEKLELKRAQQKEERQMLYEERRKEIHAGARGGVGGVGGGRGNNNTKGTAMSAGGGSVPTYLTDPQSNLGTDAEQIMVHEAKEEAEKKRIELEEQHKQDKVEEEARRFLSSSSVDESRSGEGEPELLDAGDVGELGELSVSFCDLSFLLTNSFSC